MTIVHSIIAFSIAAGLLTILPGPDTAVVLTTAIRAGHRAARRAALGIGAGLVAARAGTWLAQPRIRRILDTITGTVFAGFAVSVAVDGTR